MKNRDNLPMAYNPEFSVFGIPKPDLVRFLKISPKHPHRLVAKKEQRDYIKGGNVDLHECRYLPT